VSPLGKGDEERNECERGDVACDDGRAEGTRSLIINSKEIDDNGQNQ
jgi:hypothetical protein